MHALSPTFVPCYLAACVYTHDMLQIIVALFEQPEPAAQCYLFDHDVDMQIDVCTNECSE